MPGVALAELRGMILGLAADHGLRAVSLCFDAVSPLTGETVEFAAEGALGLHRGLQAARAKCLEGLFGGLCRAVGRHQYRRREDEARGRNATGEGAGE